MTRRGEGGPVIGSLFSGYGGLELGAGMVWGGRVAWHVENDPAASRVLEARFPGVPNHGDIRAVEWGELERVDVLTGGFPCQDVSTAGRRAGFTATTRSGLWAQFAVGIERLRPGLVVIENVRGLLTAPASGEMEPDPWVLGDGPGRPVLDAFGTVLGDLADIGYDTEWCGVRAADVGAPHGRFRIFILAQPGHPDLTAREQWRVPAPGQADRGGAWSDPGRPGGALAPDPGHDGREQFGGLERVERDAHGRGDPDSNGHYPESALVGDADIPGLEGRSPDRRTGQRIVGADGVGADPWGVYGPAIERWESVLGRGAPAATVSDGRAGAHRLSPRFVEWMMGLPDGWVTGVGLSRNDALRVLGNGVVPLQAAHALTQLDMTLSQS